MKREMKKMVVTFLIVALFITAMPAQGVEAMAQDAKKIFKCILEPTLVYQSVYGFYNNVSPVTDENNQNGLIDITGNEIVPCGKYESIVFSKYYKGVFARTKSGQYSLLDTSGKVVADFGKGDYFTEGEITSGQQVVRVVNRDSNEYREYDYSGKFLSQGTVQLDDSDKMYEICSQLRSEGDYTEVYNAGNSLISAYDGDTHELTLLDVNKQVVATYEGCKSANFCGDGYIALAFFKSVENGKILDDTIVYSIADVKGNIIVSKEEGYKKTVFNIGEVEGFTLQDERGCWYCVGLDGKSRTEIGVYDFIKPGTAKIYIAGNYDGQDEIFYINLKTGVKKSLGVFEWVSVIWDGENMAIISAMKKNAANARAQVIFDLDGNVLYDATPYMEPYSTTSYSNGYYYHVKYVAADSSDAESISVYNSDGVLLKKATDVEYGSPYRLDGGFEIIRKNGDCEIYNSDGSLEMVYEYSKYESFGELIDGIVPIKHNGKWGIYQLVDNVKEQPVLQPTPQNTPAPGNKVTTTVSNTKISKLVAGKKKVTVKLPKLKKNVKGYKIQYSLKKNFKNSKSVTTKKNSVVIKKLKSKKTYYVRVKAYTMNGKKKVYSKKWSKVLKVKIK